MQLIKQWLFKVVSKQSNKSFVVVEENPWNPKKQNNAADLSTTIDYIWMQLILTYFAMQMLQCLSNYYAFYVLSETFLSLSSLLITPDFCPPKNKQTIFYESKNVTLNFTLPSCLVLQSVCLPYWT